MDINLSIGWYYFSIRAESFACLQCPIPIHIMWFMQSSEGKRNVRNHIKKKQQKKMPKKIYQTIVAMSGIKP